MCLPSHLSQQREAPDEEEEEEEERELEGGRRNEEEGCSGRDDALEDFLRTSTTVVVDEEEAAVTPLFEEPIGGRVGRPRRSRSERCPETEAAEGAEGRKEEEGSRGVDDGVSFVLKMPKNRLKMPEGRSSRRRLWSNKEEEAEGRFAVFVDMVSPTAHTGSSYQRGRRRIRKQVFPADNG